MRTIPVKQLLWNQHSIRIFAPTSRPPRNLLISQILFHFFALFTLQPGSAPPARLAPKSPQRKGDNLATTSLGFAR
jgi:hypothetical protein